MNTNRHELRRARTRSVGMRFAPCLVNARAEDSAPSQAGLHWCLFVSIRGCRPRSFLNTLAADAAGPASTKELLRPLKEALAQGVHVGVAEIGEFLQLGALSRVQARGHFDVDTHQQIPDAMT